MRVPRRVTVSKVLKSRYQPGSRPVSWDDRQEGFETIVTDEGNELTLFSSGGQSTPAPGWELLLTNVVSDSSAKPLASAGAAVESTGAFAWTLYGMRPTGSVAPSGTVKPSGTAQP